MRLKVSSDFPPELKTAVHRANRLGGKVVALERELAEKRGAADHARQTARSIADRLGVDLKEG